MYDVSHMSILVMQFWCCPCLLAREPRWESAVLRASQSMLTRARVPLCRGSAAAQAVVAPASAGGKRCFYPALVSQPLQGEENEPVPGMEASLA